MSNEQFVLKRAHRSQARLRLGLSSVSGGGKTMGALRLARGLAEYLIAQGVCTPGLEGKIAVIDTERKSASLYADVVPFDTIDLGPPYSVDRYQQAIYTVEQAGYLICILDQVSHAWAGPGGQLEWVDTLKQQAKNPMSPWMKVTPVQQEFYDRLLRSPMHIIATTRAKSEWVIEDVAVEGGRTKKVPRKIGLQPVQREGFEYEMTSMLDIDLESHMATASKDRTRLFMDRQTKLDEECGKLLGQWLLAGEAEVVEPLGAPATPPSETADKRIANGGAPASNALAGAGAPEGTPIERIEDATSDHELAFLDVATMPDLASLFDKGQKALRSFVGVLGAPTVKPYIDRLVKAKDIRKESLQRPAAGVDTTTQTPGSAGTPTETRERDAGSADELPLDGGKQRSYVTPDDAAQLESIAVSAGLSQAEGLKALGVERFGLVLLSQFATSVELLKLAARQKADRASGAAKGVRRGTRAAV